MQKCGTAGQYIIGSLLSACFISIQSAEIASSAVCILMHAADRLSTLMQQQRCPIKKGSDSSPQVDISRVASVQSRTKPLAYVLCLRDKQMFHTLRMSERRALNVHFQSHVS